MHRCHRGLLWRDDDPEALSSRPLVQPKSRSPTRQFREKARRFMSDLSRTIQSLPWSGLVPVALLVVVGLLLWIAGRRVLRAGLIMIGLGVGGVVGWLLGDSIKMGVQPWVVMGIGAMVIAVVAALSYRVTVVASLATICGLLAPLAVLTLSQSNVANADPKPR